MSQNNTAAANAPTSPAPQGNGLGIPRTIMAYLDDRMNPVVVKELRQAVRSRFVMALINLLLVLQLVVVGFVLLVDNTLTNMDYRLGRNMFWSLHTMLLVGCVYLVPIYVAVRFAAERSTQNVDLLYTTTIRPVSIIWGKFLSGAVLTFILFSTMAPFMVLTYMLRGIDVPTILVVMLIDYLTVLCAIALAMAAMTLGGSILARMGLAVFCMIWFSILLGYSLGMSSMLIRGWGPDLQSLWLTVLLGIAFTVMALGLLILASTSLISPPTSNRALLPRLYMTLCWLISGVLALLASLYWSDMDILMFWSVAMVCVMACTAYIGVCERDQPGPRVQAKIPASKAKRFIAFFFYSGSAGGVLWSLMMTLLSLAVCVGVHALLDWSPGFGGSFGGGIAGGDGISAAIGFAGYAFGYALAAALIVRYLGMGKVKTEASLAVALALMAVGTMGPALLKLMIDPGGRYGSDLWWFVGNPMAAFIRSSTRGEVMLIGVVAWALLLAMSVPWLMRQIRAFKPLPKPAVHATPAVAMATPEPQPEVLP